MFHSLTVEECSSSEFRERYDRQPWDSLVTEPKPEPRVLDGYAETVQVLCEFAGRRLHQVRLKF